MRNNDRLWVTWKQRIKKIYILAFTGIQHNRQWKERKKWDKLIRNINMIEIWISSENIFLGNIVIKYHNWRKDI